MCFFQSQITTNILCVTYFFIIIKGSNTKVMLQVSEIELDFFSIYNITKFILDAKLMTYIEMSDQQT